MQLQYLQINGINIPSTQLNPTQHFSSKITCKLNFSSNPESRNNPIIQNLQTAAKILFFTAPTALAIKKLPHLTIPLPHIELTKEEQGQFLSAVSESIDSDPIARDALITAMQELLKEGENEKAVMVMQYMITAQPMELQWKYVLAKLYQSMGVFGEARKLYTEVYEKDSSYLDVFYHMAEVMVDCGEYEAAVRMYEDKLGLVGRRRPIELAKSHFIQRDIDKALMILEELLNIDAKDWVPYMYQIVFYSLSKRSVEAQVVAAKCRQVCPENVDVDLAFRPPRGIEIFGVSIG